LFAIEILLQSLMYILFYSAYRGRILNWEFSWCYLKKLIKQSSFLIFSGIAAAIYLKIDMVMLTKMVGEGVTGEYAVASRMSEIWYFLPTAIVTALFPALLNTRRIALVQYQFRLQKTSDGLFLLALIIVVPVILLAPWLIKVLYGVDYANAANILKVHIG